MDTKEAIQLRLPKNAIDKRAKPYWMVQIATSIVVIASVFLVLMFTLSSISWMFGIALAASLVIGLPSMFLVPRHLYRFHRWEVTDEAVYASSGWLWREWRIAPLSRIQTVDTQHGPLQQAFGLATVIVTTASAAGPIKIAGLDAAKAAEVTEKLAALTEATHGDAT